MREVPFRRLDLDRPCQVVLIRIVVQACSVNLNIESLSGRIVPASEQVTGGQAPLESDIRADARRQHRGPVGKHTSLHGPQQCRGGSCRGSRSGTSKGIHTILDVVRTHPPLEDAHHRHDPEDPLRVVVEGGVTVKLVDDARCVMAYPGGGAVNPGETCRYVKSSGAGQSIGQARSTAAISGRGRSSSEGCASWSNVTMAHCHIGESPTASVYGRACIGQTYSWSRLAGSRSPEDASPGAGAQSFSSTRWRKRSGDRWQPDDLQPVHEGRPDAGRDELAVGAAVRVDARSAGRRRSPA